MALPGLKTQLDMKVYDKWRAVIEAGLLNPVFAEPMPLTPAGEFIRVRRPSDFKPAKPLGGDGFNTDHAWDMIVLAARASRYE